MDWRAWHELTNEARDVIAGSTERVVTDCEEGVKESFGVLARQLVDHHQLLRAHFQHILSIVATQPRDAGHLTSLLGEVRNVAASALSAGVIHDVPRPEPMALRGLGKLFWDALTALPPADYLRETPP